MASKLYSPKGIKEVDEESISKYNAANGTRYLLFDPRDITEFKCKRGVRDGRTVYLYEKLQIMFGNHEIEEYCFTEKGVFDRSLMQNAKPARVEDMQILYTRKKGFFRTSYNVFFEYEGVEYYLYIVVSGDEKFNSLMCEFAKDKMY